MTICESCWEKAEKVGPEKHYDRYLSLVAKHRTKPCTPRMQENAVQRRREAGLPDQT